MDKEVNLPDNFHKSYFRIRFSDTPFLFYVKNFDIKKVLSVHPEWNFLAAQPNKSEELEFLVDIKEKTIKQVGISNSAKGTIEINSINGDTKNLISELKKNLDIQNSFYKFSSEGIYRMEFEKPIPVSLPVKKQIEFFYKYGYIAECNESLAKMYGYDKADDIIGKRLVEFHKGTDNKINNEANKAFIEAGYRINDIETEETDKNGDTRYYSNNAVGVIEDDCIIRYWGTQIDITERKKTENALRESEERYRLLVEYSPEAIVLHSKGKIIYVNNSMVKLLHYKNVEEMIGIEVLSLVHDDFKEIAKERIRKSQEEGLFSEPLEEVFLAKDGKPIDVEVTAIPFMFNSIPCTQVVIKDITSRKQDEKIKAAVYKISELAHSIDTLDELYKSVHIIVAELMPAKNFYIALYDELTKLISFPYFVDEVDEKPNPKKFGRGLTEYVIKTGKPLLADPSVFNKLIEKNEVESIGAESLDWLGVPLLIKGKVIGVVVVQSYSKGLRYKKSELNILNFISEQIAMSISAKKSEEELIQAKTSAEEASRLKSTLLSNMSHELRTPMNGILGFTEIIIEEAQDNFIKELAQYIQVSGKRLMKTLNSIMDLSQLESGQAIINLEEFDLIEEIQIVVKSFIPIANQKNLYLNFVHPLPSIKIYSDRNILQQIVSNLVDNALKFTSAGGVTVDADIIDVSEHKVIDIKITDSGIGIEKEFKDHIFKEFRQVSEGLKRNYEGSGLGLSLTKKMVSLLKGRIIVESVPGKGSMFNVVLPVQNVTGSDVKKAEKKIESEFIKDSALKAPPDLPEILLVEDNEISIKLTKQFLSKTCRMDSSSEPEEVLKMVKDKKYDLILMDINLGGDEDGLHLTKRIRNTEGYEETPIIAVTGYSLRGDKERMIEGGCTDYIKKPFEKSGLIEVIHKNLKKPGSPQK